MRKSNWIIYIILVIVSAFLLWLWYHLQFNSADEPLDLLLSIIWWVVVLAGVFIISRVERSRRERVRTCYLRPDMVFNSETGAVALSSSDADAAVDAMRDLIEGLGYGFSIEDRPTDAQGRQLPFDYVVRTEKFKIEQRAEANGPTGRERIDWRGEVAAVGRPDEEPVRFKSANELRNLMRRLYATA